MLSINAVAIRTYVKTVVHMSTSFVETISRIVKISEIKDPQKFCANNTNAMYYMLYTCTVQGGFYVTVCAPANEQRYKLSATPYETVSSLLEKALKSFNRTLAINEQGEATDFMLKVITSSLPDFLPRLSHLASAAEW